MHKGHNRFDCLTVAQYLSVFSNYSFQMSPQLRPIATKIIYNCLAQPEKKSDIIKGIENYCQWAINTEAYEDCPKLWDQLAELIVNLLLTTPETNPDEDIPKTEAKGASLNDFSPVFLAASEDDRPNKIYSLLIQTLRIMVGFESAHLFSCSILQSDSTFILFTM